MKESAGELNMTVVTVGIIGILLALVIGFSDQIGEWVEDLFDPQNVQQQQ
ncbi:MAG TPA: hypothetical protein PKY25_00095 [Bacilli bacterium]|nr:hypothetical protein [Bacilli bacterium]